MHVCVTPVCSPPAALTFLAGYSQCLYCVCVMQSDTSTAALDCPPPSAESSAAGRSAPLSLHISPSVHPSFCLLSVGGSGPSPAAAPSDLPSIPGQEERSRSSSPAVRPMWRCLDWHCCDLCKLLFFSNRNFAPDPGKVLKCTPPLLTGGPSVGHQSPGFPSPALDSEH